MNWVSSIEEDLRLAPLLASEDEEFSSLEGLLSWCPFSIVNSSSSPSASGEPAS